MTSYNLYSMKLENFVDLQVANLRTKRAALYCPLKSVQVFIYNFIHHK